METTAADKKELKASVLDGGSGFSEIPKKASPSGLSRGTAPPNPDLNTDLDLTTTSARPWACGP